MNPFAKGHKHCKDLPGKAQYGLDEGEPCHRPFQCKSQKCPKIFNKVNKNGKICAPITNIRNTCLATINELFDLFKKKENGKDNDLVEKMTVNFDSAFGVMPHAEAEKVCEGFHPVEFEANEAEGGEPKKNKETGSCAPSEAFRVITAGKTGADAKPTGMVYQLMNNYVEKLDTWANETGKILQAKIDSRANDPRIDVNAELAFGTTFGWGTEGGGVGFCTPDTNTIQTLNPLVGYHYSFGGPEVAEKQTTLGVSVFTHPGTPLVGFGYTTTKNFQTMKWDHEFEFRIYLSKTSITSNSGTGDDFTAGGISSEGGLLTTIIGPYGPLVQFAVTALVELYFACDGNIADAAAKFKEIRKDIGPVLLSFGTKQGAAMIIGAAAGLAATSILAAIGGGGVAATNYHILTIKASKADGGGFNMAAEVATLRTVEFTIAAGGVTIKPMIGFGKSLDASTMMNKLIPFELVDENDKKIEFEDQCKDNAKRQIFEAEGGHCAEPDRRSKMCKQCCELVGRVRPTITHETALWAKLKHPDVCRGGVKDDHEGFKEWFCNDSKDPISGSREFMSNKIGKGLDGVCTQATLTTDDHKVSPELCQATLMEWKTYLGINAHNTYWGAFTRNKLPSPKAAFISHQASHALYQMAYAECTAVTPATAHNKNIGNQVHPNVDDPDCVNEAICRYAGVACFPTE